MSDTQSESTEKEPTPPAAKFDLGGRKAPLGESQVWLTAMGLALGVLMTLGLLGLIFVKGLEVFWPHPIAQITLKQDSTATLSDSNILAGPITETRSIKTGDTTREEIQLMVGNRDVYRLSFHFLNAADVVDTTYPEDIVLAERMEYGHAIFYPKFATLADGTTIPANGPGFAETLNRLAGETADRRKVIADVKSDGMGTQNRKILKAERKIRALERRGKATPEKIAALRETIATAETALVPLGAELDALNAKQRAATLTFTLPTGEERTQPFGEFVAFTYPNRLSIFGKVGHFAHKLWEFVSTGPREANTEGGIFPAIFGTFVMTLLMSIAVTPFGVIAAIYLREYAKQGVLVQWVRISVNNLAGVPSIVFGVFGLGFFIYVVGGWVDQIFYPDAVAENRSVFGTGGLLWASLTLALMTLPVLIVATEEALAAVPRGAREAALACGASKWQTIQRIVLPSATPGILTGVILAMARGAGEVAPLMLVGVVKVAEDLPLDSVFPFIHAERKFMHLGFHIYDLGFQSPDSEAAKPMVFATTFLLIVLVIVMNLAAILLRNHLRKKYAVASF